MEKSKAILPLYSPAEMRLIEHFGFSDIVDSIASPVALYRLMAEKAFLTNEQSIYCDALRRGLTALNTHEVYRMTVEFEILVFTPE